MVFGRWPAFGPLGYERDKHSYTERLYDWLIENVFDNKPLFTRSFSSYLRLSILALFITSIYFTLKRLYHIYGLNREPKNANSTSKTSADAEEEVEPDVDSEVSLEETTTSGATSTSANAGRFCGDPFKRQVRELMKEYKKKNRRGKRRLSINGRDPQKSKSDDDEDDSSDDEESYMKGSKDKTDDSGTTASSSFGQPDFGESQRRDCEMCGIPLKLVEIIYDEKWSSQDSDDVDSDPNNISLPTLSVVDSEVIALMGSFTGWLTKISMKHPDIILNLIEDQPGAKNPDNLSLKRQQPSVKLMLPKGHHEFKFNVGNKKVLSGRYGKCRGINQKEQFNFIDV